jgi:hypothetical protein
MPLTPAITAVRPVLSDSLIALVSGAV